MKPPDGMSANMRRNAEDRIFMMFRIVVPPEFKHKRCDALWLSIFFIPKILKSAVRHPQMLRTKITSRHTAF